VRPAQVEERLANDGRQRSGSVGFVDDRNRAPPPPPKIGSAWPSSKPNEIRFGEPAGGLYASAGPKRIAVHGTRRSRASTDVVPVAVAAERVARVDAQDVDRADPDHVAGIRNDSSTPWSFAGPGT
jgi:hypothetical protein